jgi:TnpA family transposase
MRWHAVSRVIRVLLVHRRRSFARSRLAYGSRVVACCSHVSSRVSRTWSRVVVRTVREVLRACRRVVSRVTARANSHCSLASPLA